MNGGGCIALTWQSKSRSANSCMISPFFFCVCVCFLKGRGRRMLVQRDMGSHSDDQITLLAVCTTPPWTQDPYCRSRPGRGRERMYICVCMYVCVCVYMQVYIIQTLGTLPRPSSKENRRICLPEEGHAEVILKAPRKNIKNNTVHWRDVVRARSVWKAWWSLLSRVGGCNLMRLSRTCSHGRVSWQGQRSKKMRSKQSGLR